MTEKVSLSKAVRDAKKLAQTYRSVLQLVEAMEDVGKLENAYKEQEGLYADAKADVEKARAEATQLAAEVAKTEEKLSFLKAEADREAARGEKLAVQLYKEAEVLAKQVVADARKQAAAEAAAARHAVVLNGQELAKVKGQVADEKEKLAEVQAELAALKNKFGG
jgi:predicted  nucleic acid-binding Zn-ribbon protein